METKITTDWLGFTPIFYNTKTRAYSSNINDVLDYSNIEFDENGLNDYLAFGYSVFGNTPIKNVKYLEPHSTLTVTEEGISVTENEDPALCYLGRHSNPEDILEKIRSLVLEWQRKDDKTVVIPTSGGYDSRLLNCLVENKNQVQTFGYGISPNQEQSSEVVYAAELARILGTSYTHIPLGDYHNDCDYWYDQFGISTHLHGMYHVEFYNNIKERLGSNIKILSGIVGDIWAGKGFKHRRWEQVPAINSPEEVMHLGMTHGIEVDPAACRIKRSKDCGEEYFEKHKHLLKDPSYRILALIRTKIMLLRYLMAIPQSLGLSSWSPFLDIDASMGMLLLEPSLRSDRRWQVEFFRKEGVMIEDLNLPCDGSNNLDLVAQRRNPLPQLNSSLLSEYIDPSYTQSVNENCSSNVPAYNAAVVLLPIQRVLEYIHKA